MIVDVGMFVHQRALCNVPVGKTAHTGHPADLIRSGQKASFCDNKTFS